MADNNRDCNIVLVVPRQCRWDRAGAGGGGCVGGEGGGGSTHTRFPPAELTNTTAACATPTHGFGFLMSMLKSS